MPGATYMYVLFMCLFFGFLHDVFLSGAILYSGAIYSLENKILLPEMTRSEVTTGLKVTTGLMIKVFSTCLQWRAMASPNGCSLQASAEPTRARILLRGAFAPHSTSTRVTWGTPLVKVPVLSKSTAPI